MDQTTFMYCALIALSFGTHPIVARLAHLTPGWVSALMAIGTVPVAMLGLINGAPVPPIKSLTIGISVGLINGIGILSYGKLAGSKLEISRIFSVTITMVPFVLAVVSRLVLDEPITTNKVLGVILGGAAIYFLSR